MNREDLEKLIQKEIQEVAFEYLREKAKQQKVQSTNEYLNSSNMNDSDVDDALFGPPREEGKKMARIAIREGVEPNLKITKSEIKEFQNSFSNILDNIPGASIVFDKQKNDHSIIATKRPDGVEAKASGIINLGDNGKLIWSYSILDGFKLNAQNLKLNQSNKIMFETLFNHYDDWQKKWRENLNLPSAPEASPADNAAIQPPAAPAGQSAPPISGGAPPAL